MADHPKYVLYTGDEWSALYIDGKLDTIGDSYHSHDRIAELLGVVEHSDDAFLRGGNTREGAAHTLDELDAYVAERTALRSQAAELRRQAADLEARAAQLRERAGR
jgi:hypothetical protein